METILGLLLILLPAIFKLVEKKLKASGKTEAADAMHEWTEIFGKEEDEKEDDMADEMIPEPMRPEPVIIEPVVTRPAPVQPVRPVKRKTSSKPMLVDEEPKKKEKIDPKKLVVYSEIMNPKFKN